MISYLEKNPIIRLIIILGTLCSLCFPLYYKLKPWIERYSPLIITFLFILVLFIICEMIFLKKQLKISNRGGVDKKDRINRFGMYWIIDFSTKTVSDPLCPSCRAPLLDFHNEEIQQGVNKGKIRTFGRCTNCPGMNSFCPTDTNGEQMTIDEAKQKIRKEFNIK